MNAPMTTAQLAALIAGHMAEHGLPEPASLHLTLSAPDQQEARVQLHASGLADTATRLLAWANTQAAVTFEVWRTPDGDRVHLDLRTSLATGHGTAALLVYGGVDFDAATFPALRPDERQPVPLGRLAAWATNRTEVAA
jgi:hypothetical protein